MELMFDLETLDTSSGAVVLSIGIVAFDNTGVKASFSASIDWDDNDYPGTISMDTVRWWFNQSEEARLAFENNRMSPLAAVDAMIRWFEDHNAEVKDVGAVWANSPSFDIEIMKSFIKSNSRYEWPFSYKQERDYRTLKNVGELIGVPAPTDFPHIAVEDARIEAEYVIAVAQRLAAILP